MLTLMTFCSKMLNWRTKEDNFRLSREKQMFKLLIMQEEEEQEQEQEQDQEQDLRQMSKPNTEDKDYIEKLKQRNQKPKLWKWKRFSTFVLGISI